MSEDTKQRIIRATLQTLREQGAAGTSARAIAAAGGFNTSLLFYHFGSVEGALLAAAGLPPLSGFFAKLLILQSAMAGPQMAWLWSVILIGGFFTLIAYSRAGSIVFWRTVDGHIEEPKPLGGNVSTAAGALIALSVVMVVLAGPISEYTDATAAQLQNPDGYLNILNTPMVGEDG